VNAAEMIAKCDHHMKVELDADLEGLMATLGSNPVWGPPEGPNIVGRDAVRAHYAGILKPGRHEARRLRSWIDEGRQEAASEYVVGVHTDDGRYFEFPVVQIVEFDENGLFKSERLYYDESRRPIDVLPADYLASLGAS
jgi:hypothetical protein